jgi:hypothetical protein
VSGTHKFNIEEAGKYNIEVTPNKSVNTVFTVRLQSEEKYDVRTTTVNRLWGIIPFSRNVSERPQRDTESYRRSRRTKSGRHYF